MYENNILKTMLIIIFVMFSNSLSSHFLNNFALNSTVFEVFTIEIL
jgi:multisubunit Na+/H+ antiporter MnhG subunit